MKFTVTMKDPDTLYDAITDAVIDNLPSIEDEEERSAVSEIKEEKAREVCKKWFEYGEYLTVEIDTEAETATVVPRNP